MFSPSMKSVAAFEVYTDGKWLCISAGGEVGSTIIRSKNMRTIRSLGEALLFEALLHAATAEADEKDDA